MPVETKLLAASPESIALGAELLRKGELVAFPTETVYGLGANAFDSEAVRNIFAAKGRPADNPLIVHVWSRDQLAGICEAPPLAEKLMDAFWPGPLTLLMPRKPQIPLVVTASLPTVAVRMPSHPVAAALLKACNVPVAAPSANRSGKPSPTAAKHVMEDMEGRIPLILDGGNCEVGVESTVLDISGEAPCILRPGGITKGMLEQVLPKDDLSPAEADVMLAGITLDTKQFTQNVGTRTFSAAMYLRDRGASTADVKELFRESFTDYMREAKFRRNVEIYRGSCAITIVDDLDDGDRVIAAKAADNLLKVVGIEASFAVVKIGDVVHISARSQGSLNVQLVLENMGGGGHFDSAAVQCREKTVEEVVSLLKESIDKFIK